MWVGHFIRINYLLIYAMEDMVSGKRGRGSKLFLQIENIKKNGNKVEMKRLAEDREK